VPDVLLLTVALFTVELLEPAAPVVPAGPFE